ncbi:MAG: hypothetical protein USCGTAYLOR_02207 [Chromatiales bacterium USCg_Taylor]|nr:MAG: hypothetical protein USCGTAYLOR_02207 [Chromatiales bacterium USCg_Taylor]
MTAFGIIKTEIPLDAGLSVAGFISSEVNVFILCCQVPFTSNKVITLC